MQHMNNLKIAFINTLYHPYRVGGAEVSVQILAESLSNAGHNVHVITLHESNHQETIVHNGIHVHRLPLRNIYWPFSKQSRNPFKKFIWHFLDIYNFPARRNVKKLLNLIKPDVLHTNNISGFSVSIWDAAKSLRIPIVHTSRDYYLLHPNTTLNKAGVDQDPNSLACKVWSLIKRLRSQKVSCHISISNYVREKITNAKFFQESDNLVIYNSIDTPTLCAKQSENRSHDSIVYGYMGRITPEKGLNVLIKAFKLAPSSTQLLIAGEGEHEYIESLSIETEGSNVKFLGKVYPKDFYPRIDCLIVPSLWAEPLGRVVLESYSYRTPVIAANSGGLPEIVEPDKTGYLYKKDSADELKDILKKLNKEKIISLQENCEIYSRRFSKENIANEYLKIYLKLSKLI